MSCKHCSRLRQGWINDEFDPFCTAFCRWAHETYGPSPFTPEKRF